MSFKDYNVFVQELEATRTVVGQLPLIQKNLGVSAQEVAEMNSGEVLAWNQEAVMGQAAEIGAGVGKIASGFGSITMAAQEQGQGRGV